MKVKTNYNLKKGCDENGFFGDYGGKFVAETLMPAIEEIDHVYKKIKNDEKFKKQLNSFLQNYAGRPSPLYYAKRFSQYLNGANVFFKRDELNHTGSHKINNCIGQALIAMEMGRKRIIAETGAGQHGVAVASICAKLDLKCVIYMGAKDMKRQKTNLARMKILGAEVRSVNKGNAVLKDALSEAIRDWIANIDDSYYMIGTAAGPHPYPQIVRDFQSVIGIEAKKQFFDIKKKLPDACIACVGGGSNAIGLFYPFLDDNQVKLYGVEAGGLGLENNLHCASINKGKKGVLHGNSTYLLQDEQGQIIEGHSISAGLDYPGVGPEHSWLNDIGRVKYVAIKDDEAVEAFKICAKLEGIIPALEPAHAIAFVMKIAPQMNKNQNIIMNLCGRGDKDINTIQQYTKKQRFNERQK